MDEYIFREPPLQPNQCETSKLELYMLKTPQLHSKTPFWNVAISNTRMHLFLTLHSLAEIRCELPRPVERMDWATGGTRGLMEVILCTAVTMATLNHQHDSTFPTRRWRGMAILRATMATSLHRGKGFGGAQWVLLERWCCCCWGLHWLCAASVPSSGFSCHRYDGTLFADGHRAECGNSHHLSHRTLTSSALNSQGRRLSRQGQTITQHYSLSCNELGIEKRNWAMTADTILWFKGETEMKWVLQFNHI